MPIPNKEAHTVAKAFVDNYVKTFSVPKSIVTDRGKEMTAKIFNELCTLLEIDKHLTASYHPQANSQVEIYNKTFERIMMALIQDDTTAWEEFVVPATLAYNSQVHSATLQTPFFLTFLHPPNLPRFDIERPLHSNLDYATKTYFNMEQAMNIAKENMTKAKFQSKQLYDKKTKLRSFNVNDRVLVKFPQVTLSAKNKPKGNPKFTKPWVPGFFISRQIGPSTYYVKKSPTSKHIVVNQDRLKLDETFPPVEPSDYNRPKIRHTRASSKLVESLDWQKPRKAKRKSKFSSVSSEKTPQPKFYENQFDDEEVFEYSQRIFQIRQFLIKYIELNSNKAAHVQSTPTDNASDNSSIRYHPDSSDSESQHSPRSQGNSHSSVQQQPFRADSAS